MNLIALIHRAKRLPLDERYALLITAREHFKPRSVDMEHLVREIQHVQLRRLKRDVRRAA
jgi:hypothetical protein